MFDSKACQKELANKMKMTLLVNASHLDDLSLDNSQDGPSNETLQRQLVQRNLQFDRQLLENREQNFLDIERLG